MWEKITSFLNHPQYQWRLPEAATPVMKRLADFHADLLVVVWGISLLILCLLIYVCVKFRRSANPVPSTRSHHTLLEICWTVIPVIILVYLVFPSMHILYYVDKNRNTEMTLKIIGHQWYWEYEYPDNKLRFDSYLIKDADLKPGQLSLLEVDNPIVVPVNKVIKLLVTAGDVIHSWTIPGFGVKIDAVPGRTHESWVKITKPGIYRGQCSELCGVGHAFMPIVVKAVQQGEFDEWLDHAKVKFGE